MLLSFQMQTLTGHDLQNVRQHAVRMGTAQADADEGSSCSTVTLSDNGE